MSVAIPSRQWGAFLLEDGVLHYSFAPPDIFWRCCILVPITPNPLADLPEDNSNCGLTHMDSLWLQKATLLDHVILMMAPL